MKVQSYIPVEESTIGDFKDIQSGIRVEDLGFALNAVSKNLYSNPIGSFVRELTSNAVDANTENKSDKPVIVKTYEEDGLYYFSVEDNGKGMSEKTFTEVYMNWFNSNKRNDNGLIGGWGIGSKSPLSYVDNYELITIHEGIEYCYYIYKALPIPKATPIYKKETDKPSGTIVRFEIKENDLTKIYIECKKQLLYFHNVLVECSGYYYDNNYKILDSEHFRYRSNNSSLAALHISLGNVPYEINFITLGINPIYIPVALKFENGELPVTLSRESINYEDENFDVINLIKKKIDIVTKDLVSRYKNQMKFTDLKEYVKHTYKDTHTLDLAGYKLNIDSKLVKEDKGVLYYNNLPITINKTTIEKLGRIIYDVNTIGKNKEISIDLDDLVTRGSVNNYILKDGIDNKFSNYYHKDKRYIKIKNTSKSLYINLAETLKLIDGKGDKIPSWIYLTKCIYDDIIKIVKENSKGNYSYFPESVREEFKAKEKDRTTYITSYNGRNNREEISLEHINNVKYIFYIIKDENIDYYKVTNYEILFNTFPAYFKNNMILLVIPNSTLSKFKKRKNVYQVEQVFKLIPLRNHFNRLLIREKIDKLNIDSNIFYISKYYGNLYNELIKQYHYIITIYTGVYRPGSKDVNYRNINIVEYFREELNKRRNNKQFLYTEYIDELKSILDFLKTFLFIYESKDKEYYKIALKYLIKNSKLIKINRKFNG